MTDNEKPLQEQKSATEGDISTKTVGSSKKAKKDPAKIFASRFSKFNDFYFLVVIV